MTARAALRKGAFAIASARRTAAVALACGATAALGLRAGAAAASRVWERGGHPGAALALWLLAGTVATLVGGAGLAALMSRVASDPASGPGPEPVRAALGRGVAALSLVAVERFMMAMLALGVLIAWVQLVSRQEGLPRASLAPALALAAVPLLLVGMIAVPAFRVAVALAAAGEVSWVALARGLAVALRRFPSLVRLLLLALIATLPLSLSSFALGSAAATTEHAALAVLLTLAGGACAIAASAWTYASVLALVAGERG